MKKIILSFFTFFLSISAFSQDFPKQNEIERSTLEKGKAAVSDVKKQDNSVWITSYNSTLEVLKKAESQLRSNNLKNLDALANEAETLLQPIVSLAPANSEITVLKAYIHIIRMGKNGSDFQSERKKARELLYLEVNSDPSNPRFDLLKAELDFLTLKNSKADKNLKGPFQKAEVLLKAFKPKSKGDPSWGLTDAQYYISNIK